MIGAIVAFSIGSGFATGQKIMQFYCAFGVGGTIGALAITLVLWVWLCTIVMKDGRRLHFENANDIWNYYCGKYAGNALKWFGILFTFSCLVVMTSGAGATLHEYLGIPTQYGRILMVALMYISVFFGRNILNGLIGALGVVIIVATLIIGGISLIQNFAGLSSASAYLLENPTAKAAPTWWISGVLYLAFMAVLLIPFLSNLSYGCDDEKQAEQGGMLGGIVFMCCLALMAFALLANISTAASSEVPTLAVAKSFSSAFAGVFTLALILGIYTTVSSMLSICCNFAASDEKSRRFKIVATVICVIVLFGSRLPFGKLVNIVYPYTGYVGIIACLFVAYKHYIAKDKEMSFTGANKRRKV